MAAPNGALQQLPQQAARAEMQDWMTYSVFMRGPMWEMLQKANGESQLRKIETVLQAMVDMGLRHPSERTLCMVCALIVHASPDPQARLVEEDAVRATSLLATVKSVAKRLVTRAKQLNTPLLGGEYVVTLPGTVGELPWNLQQQMFHTIAPFPPPMDLNPIWRSANAWVCRNTNARLRRDSPRLGGVDAAALAQQTAVVAGTMMALASGGQCVSGLPGLQIFQSNAQQQAARPSPLQLALAAAEQPVASAAAVCNRREQTQAAPVMLALENGPAGDAPSSSVVTAGADKASEPPEAQVVSAKTQPAAEVVPDDDLSRSLNALANAHYDKDLPDSKPPCEEGDLDTRQKGMKRPAAAVSTSLHPPSKMKRPAAAVSTSLHPASKMKRPAAAVSTSVHMASKMKRPAAAVSTSVPSASKMKRPAAADGIGKAVAQEELNGKTKKAAAMQTITRKAAAKKFPQGCSRCRGTVGCTPSCLRRRNYKLID
eukprot:s115_g13.t1